VPLPRPRSNVKTVSSLCNDVGLSQFLRQWLYSSLSTSWGSLANNSRGTSLSPGCECSATVFAPESPATPPGRMRTGGNLARGRQVYDRGVTRDLQVVFLKAEGGDPHYAEIARRTWTLGREPALSGEPIPPEVLKGIEKQTPAVSRHRDDPLRPRRSALRDAVRSSKSIVGYCPGQLIAGQLATCWSAANCVRPRGGMDRPARRWPKRRRTATAPRSSTGPLAPNKRRED